MYYLRIGVYNPIPANTRHSTNVVWMLTQHSNNIGWVPRVCWDTNTSVDRVEKFLIMSMAFLWDIQL